MAQRLPRKEAISTPTLPNLNSDPAQYDGDDAQPALRIRNQGTGPGAFLEGLVSNSGASIDRVELGGTGAGNILAANATIGQQFVLSTPSRASGAYIKINAGLVSCTTILATTGGTAGTYALRIVTPNGQFAWIPVYPDAAVTGAAL